MLADLERIGNLTRGAEEKVIFMRDSASLAQKSSQPGKNLMMSALDISREWIQKMFRHLFFLSLKCTFVRSSRFFYWTMFVFDFSTDVSYKKSSSMMDDILRFEKTIVSQEQQILWVNKSNYWKSHPEKNPFFFNTQNHKLSHLWPISYFVPFWQWTPEFYFIKWPENARPQASHPSAGYDVQCTVQGHGGDPANHWHRWNNLWPLGPSHHICPRSLV